MLEREKLRGLFNQAAVLYHQARPEYPEDLFDALVVATGLGPENRLLEIGPGTGKATLALARRGFIVTGVEMGQDLARLARENLRPYAVSIVEARFEDFHPETPATRFGGHRQTAGITIRAPERLFRSLAGPPPIRTDAKAPAARVSSRRGFRDRKDISGSSFLPPRHEIPGASGSISRRSFGPFAPCGPTRD